MTTGPPPAPQSPRNGRRASPPAVGVGLRSQMRSRGAASSNLSAFATGSSGSICTPKQRGSSLVSMVRTIPLPSALLPVLSQATSAGTTPRASSQPPALRLYTAPADRPSSSLLPLGLGPSLFFPPPSQACSQAACLRTHPLLLPPLLAPIEHSAASGVGAALHRHPQDPRWCIERGPGGPGPEGPGPGALPAGPPLVHCRGAPVLCTGGGDSALGTQEPAAGAL